jgi:ParB family chromosome partitioning protein
MEEKNNEVVYLYLDDIIPNRFQPREVFDDQALKELAVSIREHGVIQPIIVRKVDNKYEIIAGERRYKASTMAGLTKIPAIVKNLDDKESSKVALLENLQRKNLNPIEEARTYQKILEIDQMTQEELAKTMGKSQSAVANKIRLLSLPEEVQDALLKEKISERHARSLLNIEDKNEQINLLNKIIDEKMTVREVEKEIKILNGEEVEEDETPIKEEPAIEENHTTPELDNPSLDSPIIESTEVPGIENEVSTDK